MVSIFDLPHDGDGLLPFGQWHIALQTGINDGIGGVMFVDGVSTSPVDGRALRRICAAMMVEGALRVEGEPCELGDVSRIKAALGVFPDAQEQSPQQESQPVADVLSATAPEAPEAAEAQASQSAAPALPTTFSELEALSDEDTRKLAADLNIKAGNLGSAKLRQRIADELGLE